MERDAKNRLPVSLSDEEKQLIRMAAGYIGVSMSEYIRRAVLAAAEIDIQLALKAQEEKRGKQ